MIGWDTETCRIRPGLQAPPLVCLSWAARGGETGLVHRVDAKPVIRKILEGESCLANLPYDLGVVMNEFPDLIPLVFDALANDRVFDVQTREKLKDIARGRYRPVGPRGSYTLERLARIHTGTILEKDLWRMQYGTFYDVPLDQWPEGAKQYPIADAVETLGVFDAQEILGLPDDLFADQHHQFRASMALGLMRAFGVRTDGVAVEDLRRKTQLRYDELREKLKGMGMIQKTGAKAQKLARQLMFAALGKNGKLTDTGILKVKQKLMTKVAALEALYIKIDEESCLVSCDERLIAYAQYVSTEKLLSTYVGAVVKGVDAPIHAYYEVLVQSGRTSCSGPNLQNPPRAAGVRECFVPRKGNVYIFCDYDMAELVSLSQICKAQFGFSQLADALNGGLDVHLEIASRLMGISYDDAKVLYQEESQEKFNGLTAYDARQLGKCANFGFPGGLGAFTFMAFAKSTYNVTITEERAKALKQTWLDMWPEMRLYFDWINGFMRPAKDKDGEDVKRAWIQHFKTRRKRGKCSYTATCNTFFQGLSADGCKAAMWEITRRQWCEPESALYGTRIVFFLHDEFGLECAEERAAAAALELAEVMCTEYTKFTPDVPVKAEPLICRRWSKGAKAVKNAKGELIPYLPKLFKFTDAQGYSHTWEEGKLEDTLFKIGDWEENEKKVKALKVGREMQLGAEVLERLDPYKEAA